MTAAIELENVSVTVGNATLLDRVSLRVAAGEAIAIVGPNGAGKSTLMRVLSGDQRRYGGAAHLFGRRITDYRPDELSKRRAILSQHIQVTFPFSVREIVAMGGPDETQSRIGSLVATALEEVELGQLAERDISTLSGGEQQRVHFARSLVQLACAERRGFSSVLLLDEPTSSLDLRHQVMLIESAKARARRGTAVIAVLHDLNLAAAFATRMLVLAQGRCVADGLPGESITPLILRDVFGVETADLQDHNAALVQPGSLRAAARVMDSH